MEFEDIFLQFVERRQRLKAVFIGTADEYSQPNCSPKLLVDIIKPSRVFYIDFKSSKSYKNLEQNWNASLSIMDEKTFTGYKLNGFCHSIDSGREFMLVKEKWAQRAIAYEAEWMLDRIKGITTNPSQINQLPKDFVVMKFIADEAVEVKTDRVYKAMRSGEPTRSSEKMQSPLRKIAALQGRILDLEKNGEIREKNESELKASMDFLKKTLDTMPDPMLVIHKDHKIVLANSKAVKSASDKKENIEGMDCREILRCHERACPGYEIKCPLKEVLKTKVPCVALHAYLTQQGGVTYTEIQVAPILDRAGRVVQAIETRHDVTDRENILRKLEEVAISDELTGLYNRRGFMALVEHELKVARRQGKDSFMIFCDLDGLKTINDSYGHKAGDKVLKDTARIMRNTFRDSDIISRIGGDEFAIAAIDCNAEDLESISFRLRENLDEYNRKKNNSFPLALSVGLAACYADDPVNLEKLLNRADRMMYRDKQSKRTESNSRGVNFLKED